MHAEGILHHFTDGELSPVRCGLPSFPAETWGSQVATLGNFKNKVNSHLQRMMCWLEANDEVPTREVLLDAMSLWGGQEENRIRVSGCTNNYSVHPVPLNSPRWVTSKSLAPSPTHAVAVSPPPRQTQLLQASESIPRMEASGWKDPVSM